MGREAIVAQLVLERSAFNRMVAGSNPADGIPPFFTFLLYKCVEIGYKIVYTVFYYIKLILIFFLLLNTKNLFLIL